MSKRGRCFRKRPLRLECRHKRCRGSPRWLVVMMLMTMRPKVMGAFTLPRPLWAMGWLSTAVMAVSVTIMFVTW